jgi:hypothetical protein
MQIFIQRTTFLCVSFFFTLVQAQVQESGEGHSIKPVTPPHFDLADWKSRAGQRVALKQWNVNNPKPWRNYFNGSSSECAQNWHVSLGPLGLTTLMHDRTWDVFDGCKAIYPKALTDSHGLVFNTFEVVDVKAHSPARGQLDKGDLIIGVDGQLLQAAQHTFLDRIVDNKNKRGLEIHVGQLIDRAEGRGEIELMVLRLPESEKNQPLGDLRSWKTIKEFKMSAKQSVKVDVPLGGASICKLDLGENVRGTDVADLSFRNERGDSVPVSMSSKKPQYLNVKLEVPAGKWRLTGTIVSNKKRSLAIRTLAPVEMPEHLTQYLRIVRFQIDRIGSFGDNFNPGCDKIRNYTAMMAHRLAIQQEEDGSWDAKGYASNSFHTSICGLALLSTADSVYDDHIRRAAYYVGYVSQRDKWSYSNGTWLVFLAEYYLRTRDDRILPAIRLHIANLRRFIMTDYTSGHSAGGPGYGGSGYIGGGGVIALALAIASHTPVASDSDRELVDKMLQRVQEIAPRGRVPYGRVGNGHLRNLTPDEGQGGSCGTGPYYIASRIRGGAKIFTENAAKRYSTAPFGSAENGHATQTLHFVWACLSVANTSDEAHRDNMNVYLWKFTTLRERDGFINKNNYRTEYHNGDGVIGEPYWRTAGYLLILNAYKKNLAITGAPDYQGKPRFEKLVLHHDRVVRNEFLRNWAVIDAVLGNQAPAPFKAMFEKLRSLPVDESFGIVFRELMKREVPGVARSLMQLDRLPVGVLREQLVELLFGIVIQIDCTPLFDGEDEGSGIAASIGKKKKSKKLRQQVLENPELRISHNLNITPIVRLQTDPNSSPKDTGLAGSLFPVKGLVIDVSDPGRQYLSEPARFSFDGPPKKTVGGGGKKKKNGGTDTIASGIQMPMNPKGEFRVQVGYNIGGIPIRYETDLPLPAHGARNYSPALARYQVPAIPLEDYFGSYSTRLLLSNGVVIGCEHRNHPIDYMIAGQRYLVTVSPGSMWGHDLRAVERPALERRLIAITEARGLPKRETSGYLIDEPTTITLSFSKLSRIESVYLLWQSTRGVGDPRVAHQLDAWVDGRWMVISKRNTNGLLNTLAVTTKQIRLKVNPKEPVRLSHVRFFAPLEQRPYGLMSW